MRCGRWIFRGLGGLRLRLRTWGRWTSARSRFGVGEEVFLSRSFELVDHPAVGVVKTRNYLRQNLLESRQ